MHDVGAFLSLNQHCVTGQAGVLTSDLGGEG